VVVGRLEAVSVSVVRLADRFGMPVVALKPAAASSSAHALAARILALVHTPELSYARALTLAAPKLATADSIDRILSVTSTVLNGSAALVTGDGTVTAGTLRHARPDSVIRHPAAVVEFFPDYVLASCPVYGSDHTLWLACEAEHGGPVWQDAARATLQVAAPAVAAWLARDRLKAERDARLLNNLLTELLQLDRAPHVPDHVIARATRAGIALDGWHTGIHLTWLTDPPGETEAYADTTAQLTSILAEEGLREPVFQRADGWSLWITQTMRPSADEVNRLLARVRHAVSAYNAQHSHHPPHVPLVGGIGHPAIGPRAIAATLAQARQAALAAARDQPGAVESIDHLGPDRHLATWYGEPAFVEHARQILNPILVAPDAEALLDTLTVYLDTGSSPTETASRMHMHRNTIRQRIATIEHLLAAPLTSMDRLTLHLACRAVKAAGR
jgi:sugar diacid utilization regulator